ncbi:MAG: hypothetical protein N3H31_03525 [Candidatus Nezhaarchaeota archaeon]|nr:hypothetical protein [Candidatus Nezhaarchaeota archaeon]
MESRRVASIAMMTALATALAYATAWLPNVTLMDVVVFIAGWTMGIPAGATVGCLSWLIYGTLNPYGFNPIVWISTTTCEALYGIAGGLARKIVSIEGCGGAARETMIVLGGLGLMTTFAYDLATNLAFSIAFNVPFPIALAMGAPFAVVHELSNFVLFASAAPIVLRTLNTLALAKPLGGRGVDQGG